MKLRTKITAITLLAATLGIPSLTQAYDTPENAQWRNFQKVCMEWSFNQRLICNCVQKQVKGKLSPMAATDQMRKVLNADYDANDWFRRQCVICAEEFKDR